MDARVQQIKNQRLPNAPWRAVLFDFNGVIIDDEPLHLELIQRVLGEEGVRLSKAECRNKCLGVPDRAGFKALLHEAGRQVTEAAVTALIARKADYYLQAIRERDLLFPGVGALVQRLAAQFPLALVSGALRPEVDFTLGRAGLHEHFNVIVTAEDVSAGKPHPAGFLKALACLNETQPQLIQPHECLVIEDSIAGVEAAKRAGMFCVAVTNSFAAEALQEADLVVANLAEREFEQCLISN
ncbi:MAG: HAD family phosphatase [Acidobacteria bacterium]|nr:HAD family phosphatase [Acidobacteriota bacterium]MBI3422918.1 HAD family phosphatase [Acidobacteriota bacterium]